MRLVIFDFDETIVRLHVKWNLVRDAVIREAEARGMKADQGLRLVQLGNLLSLDKGMKGVIDEIYLRYENECVSEGDYVVYSDMVALVKELHTRGLKLAIASGNHSLPIEKILSRIGLENHFEIVCGRDKVEHNKPSPDQLLLIIKTLGVPKEEAVFAGDSVYDEGAAKSAGIRFIRIEPGSANSLRAAL